MPDTRTLQLGEFLSIGELSALIGQSTSAIYTARHRGEMPAALGIKIGRRLVWRRSDVDRWFSDAVETQLEDLAAP